MDSCMFVAKSLQLILSDSVRKQQLTYLSTPALLTKVSMKPKESQAFLMHFSILFPLALTSSSIATSQRLSITIVKEARELEETDEEAEKSCRLTSSRKRLESIHTTCNGDNFTSSFGKIKTDLTTYP